jgi:hypothetical protein
MPCACVHRGGVWRVGSDDDAREYKKHAPGSSSFITHRCHPATPGRPAGSSLSTSSQPPFLPLARLLLLLLLFCLRCLLLRGGRAAPRGAHHDRQEECKAGKAGSELAERGRRSDERSAWCCLLSLTTGHT